MHPIPFGKPIIGEEERNAVLEVLDGPILVHGPVAKQFEVDFAEFTQAPEAISVSSCTAGMHLIYHTLGFGPGDEVIVPQYSFLMYRIYAKIVGAKVIFAKEKNFKVSISEIIKNVSKKTKIVFLANPNNPTGTYLTNFELLELRKKLRKNILLVVDDAYAEYMKNDDYESGLKLFKNKQNVFILRTFSKIYGLSSLRVGWGYGSKKIITALNIIKPPFNVNEVAQKAAIESLKDTKFITRSVKHNIIYAKKLKNFLNQFGINSNNVSANFLLLNFEKCKFKAKYFYEKLKMKGIILRSTESGYKIKNMLRLTIGSKKENLRFMKETENIFKK